MLSTTLKDYKINYPLNLEFFLKQYDENTENLFLQMEFAKYNKYRESLIEISCVLEDENEKDLKDRSIQSRFANKLKKSNLKAYERIISNRLFKENELLDSIDGELHLKFPIPSLISVDEIELQNHITSVDLILDFIEVKLSTKNFQISTQKTNPVLLTEVPNEQPDKSLQKPTEKWYALLYLLELKSVGAKPPTNQEGNFIKTDIEEIGRQKSGRKGQGFYRKVLNYIETVKSNDAIEKSFGKEWKSKIFSIAPKNLTLKNYIENNY